MQKDLHEKPFDEGTLKKLDIFEAYIQSNGFLHLL